MENNQPVSPGVSRGGQEKFKIWWDEEEGVVRTRPPEEQTIEEAKTFVELGREMFVELRKKGIKKVDSLHDVREIKIPISFKLRRIYTDWLKEEGGRGIRFGKTALFGLKNPHKKIAELLFLFAEIGNIKFFKTEEEAKKWIKEK